MEILLASGSPRRAELLAAAGFRFRTFPVDIDERPLDGEDARQYVTRVADAKAREADRRNPGNLVLAADTAVVVGARILGKPADRQEAAEMLRMLSGRAHDVLTGVTVCSAERVVSAVESSRVHFLQLSANEIAWYVTSGEPYDKAGGYAVQGLASRFVDRIEGSYSNVVGLPVATVYRLLKQMSDDLLS